MGYRLFRRPQISFLFVCAFVWLGLRDCGIVELWGCEFVGFRVSVLWVRGFAGSCVCVCECVCVCVFACLRLFPCRVFLCDCL